MHVEIVYFTTNSDNDHKKSDWYGIHEQICQYLIPIRSQLTFLPSEEERKKRDAQIRQKQVWNRRMTT